MPSNAQDVAVLGDYAYVTLEEGGLQAVDISDPSHPVLTLRAWSDQRMKSIAAAQVYDADGTPRKLAFVAIGTEGLSTFDITSPDSMVSKPQEWNGYYTESFTVVPAEFVTEPFMMFIADGRRGIAVVFQDLERPGCIHFVDANNHRVYTQGHAFAVAYADGYAYVADDQMGVCVIDASDLGPGSPLTQIGYLDTPGTAVDIVTDGEYVYVADGEAGVQVMRIGADHLLTQVASLVPGGDCCSIAIQNGTVFVAAQDGGLHILDVRNPEEPVLAGRISTPYALGVSVGASDLVCVADRDDGLIVFHNPELPLDEVAPGQVVDLSARLTDETSVELSWSAPGDDGDTGTAAVYEVRYDQEPIADSTWDAAQELPRRPMPLPAGQTQHLTVSGLTPGATYYFALKTRDEADNWSPLSVSTTALMTTPELEAGTVSPDIGGASTIFTYSVVYTDPEGDAPTIHNVLIDSETHEMLATGSDYAAGVRFEYATTLGWGSHNFSFAFDDGHGPLVTTAPASGPQLPTDPFVFEMVRVEASGASFQMGSPSGELGRDADETQHEVTLTRSFLLAEIEVTQTLYEIIRGENPSWFEGASQPVTDLSWYDAILFCNALSEHEGYTPAYTITDEVYNQDNELIAANVVWDREANGFRLPTEAEWEFACRAGSTTSLANGELGVGECEIDPLLDAIGWYCGNSDLGAGPRTHDVGTKAANGFSIFDMHGNVWEWCWDRYAEYGPGPDTDPIGPDGEVGDPRVRRGGHWEGPARECRSASREWFFPTSADNTTGLRVARNAS